MTRSHTTLATLTAVALLAVTGCGSGDMAKKTGGETAAARQEKAVKFAECMRTHGVADFPEPTAKGEFDYGVSVTPAVFTRAIDACKALKPPGALSSKRSPTQQAAGLRFAQCVRQNGVKDFPDPANGEPLIDTTRIPSSNQPGGMTLLNAATDKCGAIIKRSVGGQ